jgi:hypothetical protein
MFLIFLVTLKVESKDRETTFEEIFEFWKKFISCRGSEIISWAEILGPSRDQKKKF